MTSAGLVEDLNRHIAKMSQDRNGNEILVNAILPEFLPKLDPQFVEIYTKYQGQGCQVWECLAIQSTDGRFHHFALTLRTTIQLPFFAQTR